MRFWFLMVLVWSVAFECSVRSEPSVAGGEVVFGWHFAGSGAVESGEHAALKEIWRLEESRHVGALFAERLADATERQLFGFEAPRHPHRFSLVRSLVGELLNAESFGEIVASGDGRYAIGLAVKLSSADAERWDRGLTDYFASLAWEQPRRNPVGEATDWTAANREWPGYLVRFSRAGDWLLFGAGPDRLTRVPRWQLGLVQGKPPSELAGGAVLKLWGHCDSLARWLAGVPLPSLGNYTVRFVPRAKGMRTEATLALGEPIRFPLPEWDIPRELVNDPIVSFSGFRGLSPQLEKMPGLAVLARRKFPPQFFSWARTFNLGRSSFPIFPLYYAWPIPPNEVGITNVIKDLPEIIGSENMSEGNVRIAMRAKRNEAHLLLQPPLTQPVIRGLTYTDRHFRAIGLFPLGEKISPVPEALYQQLLGDDRLVGYHWEITQNRVDLSRTLLQMVSFLFGKPQLKADAPSYRWLIAVAPRLGSSAVTRITAPDPGRLEIVRNSTIGLTGTELTLLARWLNARSFPWIDRVSLSVWNINQSFIELPGSSESDAEVGR